MDFMDYYRPSVSHRFAVFFSFSLSRSGPAFPGKGLKRLAGGVGTIGIPNVLDSSFQRISGLSRELTVSAYSEGGENRRNRYFSEKVQHAPLILERGVMALTPLSIMFNAQLLGGKPMYLNVIVVAFGHENVPQTNWLISNALPVRWQTGDLDASSNRVLVNTMELRCQEIIPLGICQ